MDRGSNRAVTTKMDDEMLQILFPKHAALRQRVTGGRIPRYKWANVVGMGGRMFRKTHYAVPETGLDSRYYIETTGGLGRLHG